MSSVVQILSVDSPLPVDAATDASSPSSSERYHDLDAMRSTLMLMGVVLHATYIYSPWAHWLVTDPHQSKIVGAMSLYGRMFRMPTFFILAGFFAAMTLHKYGSWGLLKHRFLRIGIPLICTGLTVNLLEIYLRHYIATASPLTPAAFARTHLLDQLSAGEWISHLWFLNSLLVYFVLAAAIHRWLGAIGARLGRAGVVVGMRHQCLFLPLMALAMLAIPAMEKVWPSGIQRRWLWGAIDISTLLFDLPYFLLGLWLFSDKMLRKEFHRFHAWQMWLIVPLLGIRVVLAEEHGVTSLSLIRHFSEILFILLASQLCFVVFRRYFNQRSAVFRYLSDASYSIYLFHHFFVALFGYLLLPVDLPVSLKIAVIVASTYAVTLCIHHFAIRRVPLLRLMYNGDPRKRCSPRRSSSSGVDPSAACRADNAPMGSPAYTLPEASPPAKF